MYNKHTASRGGGSGGSGGSGGTGVVVGGGEAAVDTVARWRQGAPSGGSGSGVRRPAPVAPRKATVTAAVGALAPSSVSTKSTVPVSQRDGGAAEPKKVRGL